MTVVTLTADMPIQVNSELQLRVQRGQRPVLVRSLPRTMFVDAHERQCQRNHGQTLDRIRERGGFGATEAIAVLSCLGWEHFEGLKSEHSHYVLYSMIAMHNRGMRVAEAAAGGAA